MDSTTPSKGGQARSKSMSPAERQFRKMNSHARITAEVGVISMTEDVDDSDGRRYRLKISSTPDGQHALAYCLRNPWDPVRPNAGRSYWDGHVDRDGFICLGNDSRRILAVSPFSLKFAVRRARYWCTGFSAYMEMGTFPNL